MNSMAGNGVEEYWKIVEEVVRSRGRRLQRYPFFEDVWKAVDRGCRLIVVKAPTSGGKTEAASTPFLRDLRSDHRRWLSLIHVLPTRALVNSMRWRYAEALGALKIWDAVVAYEYGQLVGVRPYLDGDIVVTTYDTMLHRFYGVDLRAPHIVGQISKIVNSLLVMDEVQLLQDEYWYAMSLIPLHVTALLNCGVQVILMTATLPTILLEKIRDSIHENLHHIYPEEIATIISSSKPVRGEISIELEDSELPCSGDRLVKVIRDFYPGEGSVLIIVNTVEKAVSIYTSLLKSYLEGSIHLEPFLLHSRLRQGIRREVEKLLELRKNDAFILVATQIVEAGLDLDSTLVLTEISPIDSLIQRIGRCGRRRNGSTIIYMKSEGALKVYPEILLEKTRQILVECLDLLAESPRDVNAAQILVDQVFNQEVVNFLVTGSMRESQRMVEWIREHWINEVHLDSWAAHFPPGELLRLGVELPSYMSRSLEEYHSILLGNELKMRLENLEENIVRLTFKEVDQKKPIIPALLHEVDGKHYFLVLEIRVEEWDEEVRLKPSKITAGKMSYRLLTEIIDGRKMFLLNPAFYELRELDRFRVELGVVKPWKKI